MKKFTADNRTIKLKDMFGPLHVDLVVNIPNRLPRKIKKKIKWMSKRVSTLDILNHIIGDKDDNL